MPARASVRDDRGRRLLLGGVLALAGLAWVALAWPGVADHHHGLTRPADGMPGMDMPGGAASATSLIVPVLLAWLLMTVAMMLPPALPLLTSVRTLGLRHGRATVLVGSAASAFVLVWLGAGAAMIIADAGLRSVETLATRGHLAAAVVLLVAGAYQLSPFADRCLRACRAPRGFIARHWRGARPPWWEAAVVGASYGASCVGCCWALMAVSFAVGVAALPLMVALAVVMSAQRLLPHGRRLVRPTGVVLLVLGAFALLDLLPHGLLTA